MVIYEFEYFGDIYIICGNTENECYNEFQYTTGAANGDFYAEEIPESKWEFKNVEVSLKDYMFGRDQPIVISSTS